MSQDDKAAMEVKERTQISEEEKQTRKEQVLTQGRPSITRSIADAVVIKAGNIFFLTQPDGNVPLGGNHGFGLYYHDHRFLNGYQLKISNASPNVLLATATSGHTAIFELTNPELQVNEGEHIRMGEIGVTWERDLDGEKIQLSDHIRIVNYSQVSSKISLSLDFQAKFEDLFAIRGLFIEQPGQLHPPEWKDGALTFVYAGADGLSRRLDIQFSQQPKKTGPASAQFDFTLGARESQEILITLIPSEEREESEPRSAPHGKKGDPVFDHSIRNRTPQWLTGQTHFNSDSLLLNRILDQSLSDLSALQTSIDGEEFFAAGLPWFATLFGRDSLITALQTLSINPEVAAETLRLLASYQAHELDDWRDAQPGKILHELRIGELASLGEIPHSPYYGTVDATPLFLILLARYIDWTGKLDLFQELRNSVELALEWTDKYGDANQDGYIEYASTSKHGLINQGWKDSGDAIVEADGSLAEPPISLVEVQSYVYAAKTGIARLYERAGEQERANKLRNEAETLRSRFNQDFWNENLGMYILALEASNQPVVVVASNPGHALWAGVAEPEKARQTMERLMTEDMFNGWGVRTLSSKEKGYNPIGYHLGTIWPHDNALIAAGFRRYGFDEAAMKIFMGIIEAAMAFDNFRLPELFAGFSKDEYRVPVHYPVACHPQAWAAGSIPYLIPTFLGLEPDALNGRLVVRRPILPDFVDHFQVHRLRVGDASIDLRFERHPARTEVDVLKVDGDLDVLVEAKP